VDRLRDEVPQPVNEGGPGRVLRVRVDLGTVWHRVAVIAPDPTFQVSEERNDAAVALVEAIVAALSSTGDR
jgi:hypothetical protein